MDVVGEPGQTPDGEPAAIGRDVAEVQADAERTVRVPVAQVLEKRRIVGQAPVCLNRQRHADLPGVRNHLVEGLDDLASGGGVDAPPPGPHPGKAAAE